MFLLGEASIGCKGGRKSSYVEISRLYFFLRPIHSKEFLLLTPSSLTIFSPSLVARFNGVDKDQKQL